MPWPSISPPMIDPTNCKIQRVPLHYDFQTLDIHKSSNRQSAEKKEGSGIHIRITNEKKVEISFPGNSLRSMAITVHRDFIVWRRIFGSKPDLWK